MTHDIKTLLELWEQHPSYRALSKATGINRGTLHRLFRRHKRKTDKTKRYLFTCAQNNTQVFTPFWFNLTKLAKYYNADIYVSSLMYNKNSLTSRDEKKGATKTNNDVWYDALIAKHLVKGDVSFPITEDLIWCGETNIIPTAQNPLAGMETYTRTASSVFPHTTVAMDTVATMPHEKRKFMYTTGTCTVANYIKRKAGAIAENNHAYGALLVEVKEDGTWFARQIVADNQGTICDLDIIVENQKVKKSSVEVITWGDIHVEQIDPIVKKLAWQDGGICDILKPQFQFFHDLVDFRNRNHHNKLFDNYRLHLSANESVQKEIVNVVNFLHEAAPKSKHCFVVNSNHDRAIERWLEDADWKNDLINADFYLHCASLALQSIKEGKKVNMLKLLVEKAAPDNIMYLDVNDSVQIQGIEYALHGDIGANGARGNINTFKKMSRKLCIGHSHTARIAHGVYQAGTSSKLDLGYNKGASSWSHTFIVTYKTGKRAAITINNGAWRG